MEKSEYKLFMGLLLLGMLILGVYVGSFNFVNDLSEIIKSVILVIGGICIAIAIRSGKKYKEEVLSHLD